MRNVNITFEACILSDIVVVRIGWKSMTTGFLKEGRWHVIYYLWKWLTHDMQMREL